MKMNKIDLKNLDKSTWSTFRFDQIASSISERVDPNKTDLKHYIGLEHLDSENIHITRMGSPDDVSGQKLRCYPGDVIFGRRRAYQRKAAVCEVEGFCSAHSLVLRANPEVVDPKLFPFFLHSDNFMHRAIDISVGSLSPTINWGTLKKQEFLLPPKDQQTQLAELLWAADEVIEKGVGVLKQIKDVYGSSINEKCLDVSSPLTPLSEIIDSLDAGVSVNSVEGSVGDGEYGILKTSAVSEGFFVPEEVKKVKESEVSRLKTSVKKNSIIISRMNTVALVGANAFVDKDYNNLFLPDRLWQASISRDDVNPKYLWFILSSYKYRQLISDLCAGTSNSMKNISKKALFGIKVPLPKKPYQDQIVKSVELVALNQKKLESRIVASKALQKSLINQVF